MDTRDDDRYLEQVTEAWRMRVYEHATQEQIAAALNVHQSTISRWLAKTAREHLRNRREIVDRYFGETLARYDLIYREAMRAWEQSKEPTKSVAKRVSKTTLIDQPSQAVTQRYQQQDEETVTRVDDQDGNVRYLQAALAILADIRRLLGLDMGKTLEPRGKYDPPVPSNVVLYLPDNGRGDCTLPFASTRPSGEPSPTG